MVSRLTETITSAMKLGTPIARLIASAPTKTVATKTAAATTPAGLQRGQHRHHDAGIAEAGRQRRGHVALDAQHLDRAGQPGQPAREQATTSNVRGSDTPAKAAAAGFRPAARDSAPKTVRACSAQTSRRRAKGNQESDMQPRPRDQGGQA